MNKEDFETINTIINDIYDNVEFIDYNDFMMAFSTSFSNIRELFQTFTIDLEYETIVNEGFKISKNTSGKQFVEYINYVLTAFPKESYSNVIDICMKANNNNNSIFIIKKRDICPSLIIIVLTNCTVLIGNRYSHTFNILSRSGFKVKCKNQIFL